MVLGIDFDNTIVCYDHLFHTLALDRGLIPHNLAPTKSAVRDYLRAEDREQAWIELQGQGYGAGLTDALPFPGVADAFEVFASAGVSVYVVSHKTRQPFAGEPYDLHRAAGEWLERWALPGVSPDRAYFELTKADKLRRIASLGCDRFVDDLPEFLSEPAFPAGVVRVLFDPNGQHHLERRFARASSWREIAEIVLGSGAVS